MNPHDMPISVVIFGASGDLTHRKLIPALYNLFVKGRLPAGVQVTAVARRTYDDERFVATLREGIEKLAGVIPDTERWREFSEKIHYVRVNFDRPEDFARLESRLSEIEAGPGDRLYYLATGPEYFVPIISSLGSAGMAHEDSGWRRIIIEKPFGRDLDSAHALNETIHEVFEEEQIYRIDHYLGKETAQNILFFRFANTIFEPIWNRRYVDHIQITVAEKVAVGHRAGYYDKSGILRDMFQNHLLQLLTLVAMEPPASFNARALRNEKTKVLSAIRPIPVSDTVCGQYVGYQEELSNDGPSRTPTYAALRLCIDNWRWKDVPFYLRSGKAMAAKTSEIVVQFQSPPHLMFDLPLENELTPNSLSLCIQPDEGIHLSFELKVPGSAQETRSVNMEFHYCSSSERIALPDAYERLLLDALNGDASLFTRSDEIEMAWELMDPIINAWESENAPALAYYDAGSWGPVEANQFIARDGRMWLEECGAHRSPCHDEEET